MTRIRNLSALTALLLGLSPAGSYAATGTILPGQIEKQFEKREEPQLRPSEPQLQAPEQAIPDNARDIRFMLHGLTIHGAQLYTEQQLAAEYADLLNREVSLAEIYALARRLTVRYRNDGYILSRVVVPAQEVSSGQVRLEAFEGYISSIDYRGEVPGDHDLIRAYADQVLAVRPLTAAALERSMLLMNDLPGIFARATVAPADAGRGASRLIVEIHQRRFSGGVSVDNRGSRALGRERTSADLQIISMLGPHARTSLFNVEVASNELDYWSVSHDQPVGAWGGAISVAYFHSSSIPEEQGIIPLNLETESDTLDFSYRHPLLRSRNENLYLNTSVAIHDGETTIFNVRDSADNIRSLRIGLAYDRIDRWRGVNLVEAEFSQGINDFGASENDDPFLSRPGARVDYSKLTLYGARLQGIAQRWSLLTAVQGQYAFTDLLAPELYSHGGEQFGRGYDPSELVGDHGLSTKLELRYTNQLPVFARLGYTLYGFHDWGRIWQRQSPAAESFDSASSAGFGIRFQFVPWILGYVEYARPLDQDVAGEGDRHGRVYAGASVRF